MFAIRAERDYVIHEDFMKVETKINNLHFYIFICIQTFLLITLSVIQAVRKLSEAKKLESSSHYNADFGKE